MHDENLNETVEQQQSDRLTGQHPNGISPDLFAGEPLQGSGFEVEVPEDDFEWRG